MKTEIEKAVAWAGGKPHLAAKAGVGQRTVDQWLQDGRMPETPALLLNCLTRGRLKVVKLTKP